MSEAHAMAGLYTKKTLLLTQDKETSMSNANCQPFLILLNSTGDVTITWTDESKEAVIKLIEEKMSKRYQFMVLQPRAFKFLGNKKVPLKNSSQLKNAVGVSVPDDQVLEFASAIAGSPKATPSLGDPKVEQLVKDGAVHVVSREKQTELVAVRPAKTAQEVVQNQCVAIPVVVGG